MTWFTSSTNQAEAAKQQYLMFLAAVFDFASGPIRFCTLRGDLSFGGNTYIGAGELASVSMPEERTSLTFEPKVYRLSGVDPVLISESDIDNSFGRSTIEYFGFLNPDTHQLVDTPEINYEGRIDKMRRIDGKEPLIEVRVNHRLNMIDRPDDWCYTHEHQQLFFAGDLGFNRIPDNELQEIFWGGRPVRPGIGNLIRGAFQAIDEFIRNNSG